MCPLPREARKLLGVRDTDCLTPEAVCGHVHLILRLRHAMRVTQPIVTDIGSMMIDTITLVQ